MARRKTGDSYPPVGERMIAMKAFKVELLIIDQDDIGGEEIVSVLENVKYPNWCIFPRVKNIVGVDIGEWADDHPLNFKGNAEYDRLFHSKG